MKVYLMCKNLFSTGDICKGYLNVNNGESFSVNPQYLNHLQGLAYNNLDDLIELPQYSIAHVHQLFLRAWLSDSENRAVVCREYLIDDSVTFALVMDMEQYELQENYVNKTHALFEEKQVQANFQRFFHYYSAAYSVLYCAEHGYEWEEYTIHRT